MSIAALVFLALQVLCKEQITALPDGEISSANRLLKSYLVPSMNNFLQNTQETTPLDAKDSEGALTVPLKLLGLCKGKAEAHAEYKIHRLEKKITGMYFTEIKVTGASIHDNPDLRKLGFITKPSMVVSISGYSAPFSVKTAFVGLISAECAGSKPAFGVSGNLTANNLQFTILGNATAEKFDDYHWQVVETELFDVRVDFKNMQIDLNGMDNRLKPIWSLYVAAMQGTFKAFVKGAVASQIKGEVIPFINQKIPLMVSAEVNTSSK